jgi:replicative DNA helicase Mcm
VIRSLADENGRARLEDVIERVTERGHPKDDVRKQIELFIRAGEAMEPKTGIIKLIN